MKVNFINESKWDYSYELIAETVEEAAFIVRMGMNKTKKVHSYSNVSETKISTYVVFGKKQRHGTTVPEYK